MPPGSTSIHSSGELPEAVPGFGVRGGGHAFGAAPHSHVRTGSLTLSTLSRQAGHFGSGHSAGAPGGVSQALGVAGWGASGDLGSRPTGPPQHSQSVPATPTMLMDSASGVAAGGRFAALAGARESASAPLLPTASSGAHQPREASSADGVTGPSATAVSHARVDTAAGEDRSASDCEAAATGAVPAEAAAEQDPQLDGGAVKQPSRGASAIEASGSGDGGAQPRRKGLRKNKFSSFSSDLPPDRHWPPGAASSAGTDSTTPVDASPLPPLRPEQQVRTFISCSLVRMSNDTLDLSNYSEPELANAEHMKCI